MDEPELEPSSAMRIAHDSGDQPPTSVRIPEPREREDHVRQRAAIDAMDLLLPRVVRVANGARIAELHLAIADAIRALESGETELALKVLRDQQADRLPTRGRKRGRTVLDLGTS